MLPDTAVVVADAHLGPGSEQGVQASFLSFLAEVPSLGRHLVVNGDLFEFWFEYRHVIPREAFRVLSALASVRSTGVELTVVGGNHDRWGRGFWTEELGATFAAREITLRLAGWNCFVTHGDGVAEQHAGARLLHGLTRNGVSARAFSWVHPDLGYWMVQKMSRWIGDSTRDPAILEDAAHAQEEYARKFLERRPEVDIAVLAHTHRAALEPIADRRWYLNPGAWLDGARYGLIDGQGPRLCRFDPTTSAFEDLPQRDRS